MNIKEIKENLCYYDERNPEYNMHDGKKQKDCYCDNCFYGRDTLANELIKSRQVITELLEACKYALREIDKQAGNLPVMLSVDLKKAIAKGGNNG